MEHWKATNAEEEIEDEEEDIFVELAVAAAAVVD